MELVRLTQESILEGFDCGDEDLNEFLVEDAKDFLDKRIAGAFRQAPGQSEPYRAPDSVWVQVNPTLQRERSGNHSSWRLHGRRAQDRKIHLQL